MSSANDAAVVGVQDEHEHHQHQEKPNPTASELLKAFAKKAKAVPARQKLIISFLVVLVIAGNAMNIIGLNFWLRHFQGKTAGVFTTLIVSGLIFTLFFAVSLVVYIVKHRPKLRWALTKKALWTLFWIGFWDGTNSWLTIYATTDTPEILQAIFLSIAPMFTLIFSKVILKDTRSYANKWVIGSFGLMLISVIIASFPDFTSKHDITNNKKWWSMIFFLAVPQLSIYNVYQTQYMRDFTCVEGECCDSADEKRSDEHSPLKAPMLGSGYGSASPEDSTTADCSPNTRDSTGPRTTGKNGANLATTTRTSMTSACSSSGAHPRHGSRSAHVFGVTGCDDSTVKIVMLFGDTLVQWVLCLMLLPADALPWFGGSATVDQAWDNLLAGLLCLFTCKWNFLFCLIYSMGYVFTYVGCAYLNHYSATLSALITQLSSPMTAVILIIFPVLNANEGAAPWYLSVLAVIVMIIGTLIYTVWEEMTAPLGDGDSPATAEVVNGDEATGSKVVAVPE